MPPGWPLDEPTCLRALGYARALARACESNVGQHGRMLSATDWGALALPGAMCPPVSLMAPYPFCHCVTERKPCATGCRGGEFTSSATNAS